MDLENVVVEFQLDDNVVYVTRRDYLNKYHQRAIQYVFSFGTLSGGGKSSNSTHKTLNGAMKKFNKAVDALKNGTNIK
jgi:hypothetical protein